MCFSKKLSQLLYNYWSYKNNEKYIAEVSKLDDLFKKLKDSLEKLNH